MYWPGYVVSCSHSALDTLETWDTLETASLVQHPQQLSSCDGTLHCIFPDMRGLSSGDAGGGGQKLESVNWFVHLRPPDPGGVSRRQPHMGNWC